MEWRGKKQKNETRTLTACLAIPYSFSLTMEQRLFNYIPIDTCFQFQPKKTKRTAILYLLRVAQKSNEKKKWKCLKKTHISRLGIGQQSGWSIEVGWRYSVCKFKLNISRSPIDAIDFRRHIMMRRVCNVNVWCAVRTQGTTCWRPPFNLSVPFLFMQNWNKRRKRTPNARERQQQQPHLRRIFMLYYSS